MIALISSVPEEGKLLIRQLKKTPVVAGKPLYGGRIQGGEVIYMISGIGKVNAAHAATVLIETFSPGMIVLFGVGGAYPSSRLKVGDVVAAEKEVYGDEGVQGKKGFQGIDAIGIPLAKRGRKNFFNEFPLDARLVGAAKNGIGLATHQSVTDVPAGTFVTVSACTGTKRRANELETRFKGICENMEGASVAHICTLYGVPLVEVRGISNIVEDRNRGKWNIRLAAENCQKAVIELLKCL
jgi:futalosine hydrolase